MAGADGGVASVAPFNEIDVIFESQDDWRGVAAVRPDMSAQIVLTRNQVIAGCILALSALAAALYAPLAFTQTIHWFLVFAFTGVIVLKQISLSFYWAYRPSLRSVRARFGPMPIYTLLCPLYREAESVQTLVRHLQRLDYPQDRLDVIFILEGDDHETRAALLRLALPPNFRIVIAPTEGPRTKPKAMNAALHHARGAFVAVYDAEDAPHPGQIKAALSMFAASPRLGCVQAPLVIDNFRASWIAGQFALEYALQFRILLPAMMAMGLPAPLGGTSNHFCMQALHAIGAWDPYNVTEDADIGLRLHRLGWRSATISPPTYEEAPVTFSAWRRQRTRWIKGHLQTWLVHMRAPFSAIRDFGLFGFLGFQAVMGGVLLSSFLHAPLLVMVGAAIWFNNWMGVEDIALVLLGYVSTSLAVLSLAARNAEARRPFIWLTMPLYWPLAGVAALGALWGLLHKPHFWAKTHHGQSKRATPL